jgi:hypothetical protein
LPQPSRSLGSTLAVELIPRLVGLEQRLLDDVGRIEFCLPARIELKPRQQSQVIPEAFQVLAV